MNSSFSISSTNNMVLPTPGIGGNSINGNYANQKLNDIVQTIELQGNDSSNTYQIVGKEVNIVPSKNSIQARINASNKIKVNRIVNYEWDQRFNNGHLICVHKSGLYFAYSIRVNQTGKVRIFHKKLNEKVLLKSFTGRVVDLSFAHCDQEVLLGCLDEIGCLQIFKITLDSDSKMQTSVILTIASQMPQPNISISTNEEEMAHLTSSTLNSKSTNILDSTQRIIWCTYVPESNEIQPQKDENSINMNDASKVFVLLRKNQAEIFNLNLIQKNYDCTNPLDANKLITGHLAIHEHNATILTACFSPDASAITTSSVDGEVNLFKLSFDPVLNEEEGTNENDDGQVQAIKPMCLKKWHPHGNKPVTTLYFLDDHKNTQPDAQFWSFLLTGADFNREIKLWSCSNWDCVQTINLKPDTADPLTNTRISMFKTAIDLSSKYLVLSDISRKCFYVLHIHTDLDANLAYCVAISEFILAHPAISYAIIDSQQIKAKKYNQLNNVNTQNSNHINHSSDYDLNSNENSLTQNDLMNTSLLSSISNSNSMLIANNANNALDSDNNDLVTMIRLYCIQTKQLQEMQIFLSGDQSVNAYNNNSVSPPPPLPVSSIGLNQQMLASSVGMAFIGSSSLPTGSTNLTSKSSSSSTSSLLQQLLPNISATNKHQRLNPSQLASSNFSSEPEESSHHNHQHHHAHNNRRNNQLGGINSDSLSGSSVSLNANNKPRTSLSQHHIKSDDASSDTIKAETVLMTPDAFINSPNSKSGADVSVSPVEKLPVQHQQKNELVQSFMGIGQTNTVNNSTNKSINSLLLSTSSRASSLTQVTSATNLINPSNNNNNGNQVTNSISVNQPLNPVTLINNDIKVRSSKRRTRSSTSSTSSSTTSSSGSSELDQEIALLSSNTNNIQKANDQIQVTSTLLNKVSIENEEDDPIFVTKPKMLLPKPTKILDKTDSNTKKNETTSKLNNNIGLVTSSSMISTSFDETSDIRTLLVHLTNTLNSQREEIENLRKQQINSTNQLKNQMDSTIKQLQKHNISSSLSNGLLNDDSTIQQISSNILVQLLPKLDKLLKDEMNKNIQLQFSTRLLDPIREQMSRDLAEKVKSMDNILKDSVGKLFKSKSTLDSISQSVVNSMQGTIVNTYRETFQKVIVPNFEKSCQNMYQQVNNSFAKGTQDYLLEFDQLAKQHRKLFDENKEPLLVQMKQFNDQMHTHGAQVAADMASNLQQQFDNHLRNTNAILQDTIISSVKAIIKEEIQLAMREQQHTLPDTLLSQMRMQSGANTPINTMMSGGNSFVMDRSGGITPAPNQDTQSQITSFLQKGQLNSAFQVALCAADLNLLMNLCELVNPSQVFDSTLNTATKKNQCQLQQPVILSLIQQLSQDLTTNVELKMKYLEEALVNLDMSFGLTREHTPAVIGQLQVKLQQFIQARPNEKITKTCRMLLMASQSLLLNTPKQTKQFSNNINSPQIQKNPIHHDNF